MATDSCVKKPCPDKYKWSPKNCKCVRMNTNEQSLDNVMKVINNNIPGRTKMKKGGTVKNKKKK